MGQGVNTKIQLIAARQPGNAVLNEKVTLVHAAPPKQWI
jgi:hypothetical protein